MQVITPASFGASLDGVTDDTSAVQRTFDYFARSSPGSGILDIPGVAAISDTVTAHRTPLNIRGYGWGASTSRYASGFRWIGADGGTMLRLQGCWAAHLYGLMFLAKADSKAQAVSLTADATEGLHNSYNRIERCMFGSWPWWGSGPLSTAIAFEGDNVNNDKNLVTGCIFRTCDVAYDQQNSQHVMNRLEHSHIYGCGVGVRTVASLTGGQIMFAHCDIDAHIMAGADVTYDMVASERSGLMAQIDNSSHLTARTGYFQVSDSLADGETVVDYVGNNIGSVQFDNFAFNRRPGYDGSEPKLRVKASPGGAATKLVRLRDVSGIDPVNLDVDIQSPSDKRIVEHDSPKDGYHFRNVLDGGGSLDTSVWDNAA